MDSILPGTRNELHSTRDRYETTLFPDKRLNSQLLTAITDLESYLPDSALETSTTGVKNDDGFRLVEVK